MHTVIKMVFFSKEGVRVRMEYVKGINKNTNLQV